MYCIDHALVTSVSSGILVNAGHLLENLVFIALRRLYPEVYYSGREVDFIVPVQKGAPVLVQACETLADPQTKKREVAAPSEAMTEYGVASATIVTRNESDRVTVAGGEIEVIPVWRFLLDLPEALE